MSSLCFPGQTKEHRITAADIKRYRATLWDMKGKRTTCIAMFALTEETIYQVSLTTIKKAIAILKKIIARGPQKYTENGKTFRLMAKYQKAKDEYDFTVLQVQLKMHPSRGEQTLFEMIRVSEEQEKQAAIAKENANKESDGYKSKKDGDSEAAAETPKSADIVEQKRADKGTTSETVSENKGSKKDSEDVVVATAGSIGDQVEEGEEAEEAAEKDNETKTAVIISTDILV